MATYAPHYARLYIVYEPCSRTQFSNRRAGLLYDENNGIFVTRRIKRNDLRVTRLREPVRGETGNCIAGEPIFKVLYGSRAIAAIKVRAVLEITRLPVMDGQYPGSVVVDRVVPIDGADFCERRPAAGQ